MNKSIYLALFIITAIAVSDCLAKNSKLLSCLAKEEASIHRQKIDGPIYILNQKMIGEIAQLNEIDLSTDKLLYVCISGKTSNSLKLLKLLLFENNDLFIVGKSQSTNKQMQLTTIKMLIQKAPEIFMHYVSLLQAKMPTADCFQKYLPGFSTLILDYKYISIYQNDSQMIQKKQRLKKMFNSIANLDRIKARCLKDWRKRDAKIIKQRI